jgi:type II secretory pathway pseudopilin PulG
MHHCRRRPSSSPSIANRKSQIANAFTLIELLVVIGIIVLVVLLTIPVLNVLQGNRSADAAQNQLQALLNESRMMAIGLQRDCGIMFYIDPGTKRIQTVLVRATDSLSGDPDVEVFLDLVPDHESVPLTLGLSLQTIDNATVDLTKTPPRQDDGYIGFNTDNPNSPQTIQYGGVILFDGHGQLACRTYGFRMVSIDPAGKPVWSEMGKLLSLKTSGAPPSFYVPGGGAPATPPPQSAFGLVVFNAESFKSQDFTDADTQLAGSGFDNGPGKSLSGYAGAESKEEEWIDQNSVPLMINRYNGTLIKGE